ncbi:MAG: hypothetical protein IJW26_06330, partial [Clostridia bacterium]|nr:hypothetical protein [Clostridia bacterium]
MYVYNTLEKLYKNTKPKNFSKPENVVSCKIDKELLLSKQREYLSDLGEEFLYIKGTEPTQFFKNEICDKIYDINLNLNKNSISINYKICGYDGIKIDRVFKNKTKQIYEGNDTLVTDKLNIDGEYLYVITPYKIINNKKVYYEKINLSRINYKNLHEIINKDS